MPVFLPGLHGLRALAASSVLYYHLFLLVPTLQTPASLDFVEAYFGLGVQLFFVLSAFSLAHSTRRVMERPNWVRNFAIKRFFRIAPLFYAMLLIYTIYYYTAAGVIPSIAEYIINLTFLYGFVPGKHISIVWAGWTLGVEMIFYALFPMILVCVRGVREGLIFFLVSCAIALAFVALVRAEPNLPADFALMGFPRALPSFAAGLFAYWVYARVFAAGCPRRATRLVGIGVVLVAGWLAVLNGWWLCWSVAFGAACVWQAHVPDRIVASPVMQWIGERSYSIYLLHAFILYHLPPFVAALHGLLPSLVAFTLVAVVAPLLVMLAANVTYRLVEVPFIRLGHTLPQPHHPMAMTSPASEAAVR